MRVAIIGGYGQMGRWFSEFYMKKGDKVVISGRDMKKCMRVKKELGVDVAKTNAEAVRNADMVIISVMVDDFEKVVKQIAPYVKKGQKVIDITSVKEEPVRIMHKYLKNADVLGTHPMFGPGAKAKGQNFILTPTNQKERRFAKRFGGFLRASGFNVVKTSPKRHDRSVGVVLSLTHFVGFVTGDTWKELEADKLIGLSSTSFKFLKQFVKSIVDSSPELYSYLQMNVPSVPYAESAFMRRSKIWADMARKGKRKEFMSRMKELKRYINSLE